MRIKPTSKAARWPIVIVGVLGLTVSVYGQPGEPSLDDLLDLTPDTTESPTQPDAPVETQDPAEAIDESVTEALSAQDAADAFMQALDEMDKASRRLGREFDPGIETQRIQESILRKLDQAIEAAKQQNSGGGSGKGEQAQQQDAGAEQLAGQQGQDASGEPTDSGQQPSTGAAGTGSPIDPDVPDTPIEQLRKEWGVLPPHVREELSDGLRERFSPLYRRLTEAYYKALAEQE